MTRRIVKRPAALADLTEHAAYIALDNVDAAERFLSHAEATIGQLASMPLSGRPWTSKRKRPRGIRVRIVPGFRNHLIFYRVNAKDIEIVRVLHGARDLESALRE